MRLLTSGRQICQSRCNPRDPVIPGATRDVEQLRCPGSPALMVTVPSAAGDFCLSPGTLISSLYVKSPLAAGEDPGRGNWVCFKPCL